MSAVRYPRFHIRRPRAVLSPFNRDDREQGVPLDEPGGVVKGTGPPLARLLWGLENELFEQPEYVWGFLQDALRLKGCWAWPKQREAFLFLISLFFRGRSEQLAWASAAPCKQTTVSVFGRSVKTNDTTKDTRWLGGVPQVDLDGGVGRLPRRLFGRFKFARRGPKTELVQLYRKRVVEGTGLWPAPLATEWPLFWAQRGQDQQLLTQGYVPFQTELYDHRRKVLVAPHITLAKLDVGQQLVTQFNITLEPGEALTCSLMAGQRPFELFFPQHPVDRRLLVHADILHHEP